MTLDEPCPDCGDDPANPKMHRRGCPRTATCGQTGPPWIDPPWHRWVYGPGIQPGPGEYHVDLHDEHRAAMHGQQEWTSLGATGEGSALDQDGVYHPTTGERCTCPPDPEDPTHLPRPIAEACPVHGVGALP